MLAKKNFIITLTLSECFNITSHIKKLVYYLAIEKLSENVKIEIYCWTKKLTMILLEFNGIRTDLLGFCRDSLGFVGFWWYSMAFNAIWWYSTVFDGIHGWICLYLMVFNGIQWYLMVFDGIRWYSWMDLSCFRLPENTQT